MFVKTDENVVKEHFQLDMDCGVVRLSDEVDAPSFVAGMRACEAVHQRATRMVPVYNDALRESA